MSNPAMPIAWTFQHHMKAAPHPFEDLDFKAAQRLVRAGFTSREQVLEAVQTGRLSASARERPRQYGRSYHGGWSHCVLTILPADEHSSRN